MTVDGVSKPRWIPGRLGSFHDASCKYEIEWADGEAGMVQVNIPHVERMRYKAYQNDGLKFRFMRADEEESFRQLWETTRDYFRAAQC